MKKFCENPLVVKFVTDVFDKEYTEYNCPRWVNFRVFQEDMVNKLSKELYEWLKQEEKEYNEKEPVKTNWSESLHIPFTSNRYTDYNLNSDYDYSDLEITIPKNIASLIEYDKPKPKPNKIKGPKKPQSAYMYFASDNRKKVMSENPTLGLVEITVIMANKWKELSESERSVYVNMENIDKTRYTNEL